MKIQIQFNTRAVKPIEYDAIRSHIDDLLNNEGNEVVHLHPLRNILRISEVGPKSEY